MSVTLRSRARLAALAAVVILASCGPLANNAPGAGIARAFAGGLVPGGDTDAASVAGGGQGAAGPALGGLTRAAIEAAPTELMLASVPSRGSAALLLRAGQNRDEVTWLSEDGISVTYEGGVIVATRGFGPDLMGADVSGTRAAIRAGGGSARRVHDYLDGLDQIVRRDYDCRISAAGSDPVVIYERRYDTVRYDENCVSGAVRFTNSYWVDASGNIWKSRQLVSPPLGYLDSERL